MSLEFPHLLRALKPGDLGSPTVFCPSSEVLAAWFEGNWFEGKLSREDGEGVARHLAGCAACRACIGLLDRLSDQTETTVVSGELLARAKLLVAVEPGRRRKKRPRKAAIWGVAAAAVLTLALLPQMVPQGRQGTDFRSTRSVARSAATPAIMKPASDAKVAVGALQVQWTAMEQAIRYELTLLDEAGQPLLSRQLSGTEWRPEGEWSPRPGGRYYVKVIARLQDGRAAASEHIAFSIAEP